MRSRACPVGFAAPGKQAGGLFSARTGRQPLEIRKCGRNICQGVVWRGRSPSIINPQQRHARCEDECLRSGACPAGAKILSLRLCRPGVPQGRQAKARGFPKGGQVPLSRAVQQPRQYVFVYSSYPTSRRYIGTGRSERRICSRVSSSS